MLRRSQTLNAVVRYVKYKNDNLTGPGHVPNPPLSRDRTKLVAECRGYLRSILRECSYLPDPVARAYLPRYVLDRFRKYSFTKIEPNRDVIKDLRKEALLEERLQTQRLKARRSLRRLRRANEGQRKALLKVLLLSYGRTGARRRELLGPLQKEYDYDVKQEPQSAPSLAPTKRTPMLHALMNSQLNASPSELTRPNLRQTTLQTPEWKKLSRQRQLIKLTKAENDLKKEVHSRLLPPLPAEEWQQLRNFARGFDLPSSIHIPRRAMDVRAAWPKTSLEYIIENGKVDKDVFGSTEGHAITPRFMQRLWAQVFGQCPKMDWDVEKQAWQVTWGEHALYEKLEIEEDDDID